MWGRQTSARSRFDGRSAMPPPDRCWLPPPAPRGRLTPPPQPNGSRPPGWSARLPCTCMGLRRCCSRSSPSAPASRRPGAVRWLRVPPRLRKWRWHGMGAATGYPVFGSSLAHRLLPLSAARLRTERAVGARRAGGQGVPRAHQTPVHGQGGFVGAARALRRRPCASRRLGAAWCLRAPLRLRKWCWHGTGAPRALSRARAHESERADEPGRKCERPGASPRDTTTLAATSFLTTRTIPGI